jgi:hypothetical protein
MNQNHITKIWNHFFILQDTNILGFKGPRKMCVLMPGMSLDHQRVEIRPRNVWKINLL